MNVVSNFQESASVIADSVGDFFPPQLGIVLTSCSLLHGLGVKVWGLLDVGMAERTCSFLVYPCCDGLALLDPRFMRWHSIIGPVI